MDHIMYWNIQVYLNRVSSGSTNEEQEYTSWDREAKWFRKRTFKYRNEEFSLLTVSPSSTIHEIYFRIIIICFIISLVENKSRRTSLVLLSKVSSSRRSTMSPQIFGSTLSCFGCPHVSDRATTPRSGSSYTQGCVIFFLYNRLLVHDII